MLDNPMKISTLMLYVIKYLICNIVYLSFYGSNTVCVDIEFCHL